MEFLSRRKIGINSLSFKNLRRRKLRSILTMLGVVIGVTALVVLVGLTTGMTNYMKESTTNMMGDVMIMNSTGGGNIMSQPGSSFLSPEAVDKLKTCHSFTTSRKRCSFSPNLTGQVSIL